MSRTLLAVTNFPVLVLILINIQANNFFQFLRKEMGRAGELRGGDARSPGLPLAL
jgi:hypothetical protein